MSDTTKWFVYILECSDGTYYTGITNNLDKRIKKHNNGTGAKYTKYRSPVKLLVERSLDSKSEALKLEYKVKEQPKNKKIEFLINY